LASPQIKSRPLYTAIAANIKPLQDKIGTKFGWLFDPAMCGSYIANNNSKSMEA